MSKLFDLLCNSLTKYTVKDTKDFLSSIIELDVGHEWKVFCAVSSLYTSSFSTVLFFCVNIFRSFFASDKIFSELQW
jgi:hypothetical protein